MNPKKMKVGKVPQLGGWYADCPVCPLGKGFITGLTWEQALAWGLNHTRYHPDDDAMQYIERTWYT